MAGITNRAFRRLAREQARAVLGAEPARVATARIGEPTVPPAHRGAPSSPDRGGVGLYVTEMVTSRALVERNAETLAMVAMDKDESPRSVQLYGVDPQVMGDAVRLLLDEDRADHIDLNFGCPVPKVTRKGGGAALPWKRGLFAAIVRETVRAADGRAPVTVKMRKGIDDDHLTYLEAGRTAAREGAAWVALHARTASQLYGGHADRDAIARLVAELAPYDVPVLGNGDLWTAQDALDLVRQTGCEGIVVGRGCLGRPWLFGQLVAAFTGRAIPPDPDLRTVTAVMRRHAELLTELYGPVKGIRDFRKHHAWYTKGFRVGSSTRQQLGLVDTLADVDALIAAMDLDQPFPTESAGSPRGRTSTARRVVLPERWLDSQDDLDGFLTELALAELSVSGG
ncbi:MAG: tRNA dihydrouridine synthase DusB [Candidatus Nanopelagicales bacterium]